MTISLHFDVNTQDYLYWLRLSIAQTVLVVSSFLVAGGQTCASGLHYAFPYPCGIPMTSFSAVDN